MRLIKISAAIVVVLLVAGLGFVYGGVFNVAADDPHWGLTQRLLEATRDRSIVKQARGIEVPPRLDDPAMVATGAQEYAEMCTGCHLAPGMKDTEMRTGLYPKPPNLSKPGARRSPEETFWVIKHGLKMTGMPAWGLTHDDQRIWTMVAFVQKLPGLSPSQYQALIEQGDGPGHTHGDEMPGHSHGEASMPHEDEDGEPKGNEAHESGQSHTHTHSDGSTHTHREALPARTTGTGISGAAAAPVAVVDRFFRTLARNDAKAASALLDPDVLIYESGSIERSRREYASHHLENDATFLKAVKHRLLSRSGDAASDWAWVATEADFSGTADHQPVNMVGTETMILRKRPEGWRITHIHWSNRPTGESKP